MQSFRGSQPIAELIGAIIGDGNIYNKRPTYVELCGNPHTDRDYFEHVLLPIVKTALNRNPRIFVRSNGLRFRINSKSFVDWLKEEGLPAGEQKAHATIPNFIAADPRLRIRCIRGIFDTDGSVYFDRRPAYRRPYPRIDLHMRNSNLVNQLDVLLTGLGITHSFLKDRCSIQTSGVGALKQFLEKIGFANSRHLSRIMSEYPELVEFNSSSATNLKNAMKPSSR